MFILVLAVFYPYLQDFLRICIFVERCNNFCEVFNSPNVISSAIHNIVTLLSIILFPWQAVGTKLMD